MIFCVGCSVSDSDYRDSAAAMAAQLDAQGNPPGARAIIGGSDKTLRVDDFGRMIIKAAPKLSQLPPDAPVRALGTHGNKCYFLDAHSQLRELPAKEVNRTMILHMFGSDTQWIYDLWPVLRKGEEDLWVITGWDATKAQESMLSAVARRGLWRPQDHVRGRGTWDAGKGRLVVHAGDRLYFSDGKSERPGLIGTEVYPASTLALAPARKGEGPSPGEAAEELLDLFNQWNWARPFDARLLLGWVIASMVAGALKIRPLVWVTGEKGTGKSSLVGENGIIHEIFGDGILMTANTTAAGLYQKIGYDALPVAIDEIEAKRGNQKTEAVIELARQAYSGGMVLRGGADHEGKEFRAMCPVLFGSILIPPLMPQDLSRLALLNLRPFDTTATEPKNAPGRLAELGRALLRGMLESWPRWPERLDHWREYLQSLGHDQRASGQFGTLLAMVDLMMFEKPPSADDMEKVAGMMTPNSLKETQAASSNASLCVGYAMSRPLHSSRGGEQMMVSELIACSVRRYGGEMESPVKPLDAVRYLERAGVSVLAQHWEDGILKLTKPVRVAPAELKAMLDNAYDGGDVGVFVAFSPDGDGILELFRGSDWEGAAGAHNPYVQALERVPGARKAVNVVRVGVRSCRPILVPISECVDLPSDYEVSTGHGYDK
jgi:hypothetical protein